MTEQARVLTKQEAMVLACHHAGGGKQIAEHFKISQTSVYRWCQNGAPEDRCEGIEELTKGLITKEQLRPDINWEWR